MSARNQLPLRKSTPRRRINLLILVPKDHRGAPRAARIWPLNVVATAVALWSTSGTLQALPCFDPQSCGRIMLSGFPWSETVSFSATGLITAWNKTMASREFTV